MQRGSLDLVPDTAQYDMSSSVGALGDERGLNNEVSTSLGMEDFSYAAGGFSLSSAFGGSSPTPPMFLEAGFRRAPHRAWEEGYQSPFSQSYHDPVNPRYNAPTYIHSRGAQLSFPPDTASIRHSLPPVPSAHSDLPVAALNTSTALLHSTTVPRSQREKYRPRTRKVITKELTPDDIDISALVTLGMSPFIASQDIIANQNRSVRNECIFSGHFVRLQRVTAASDARHAKVEQNIYEHLEQHQLALNKLADGTRDATAVMNGGETQSVRNDPDFLALEKAHEETYRRLKELSQQVAESSESIQRALLDLAQRLDQILAQSRPNN